MKLALRIVVAIAWGLALVSIVSVGAYCISDTTPKNPATAYGLPVPFQGVVLLATKEGPQSVAVLKCTDPKCTAHYENTVVGWDELCRSLKAGDKIEAEIRREYKAVFDKDGNYKSMKADKWVFTKIKVIE